MCITAGGRQRTNPGRIADYDPVEHMGGGGGTQYSNRNSAGARQVYDSNLGRGNHFKTVDFGWCIIDTVQVIEAFFIWDDRIVLSCAI